MSQYGSISHEDLRSGTVSCFSGCMDKMRLLVVHHEKAVFITGMCLGVLLALIAVGLVGMAGAIASPALLVAGLSMLVVSFVVLALSMSKLMMKQQEKKERDQEFKMDLASLAHELDLLSENVRMLKDSKKSTIELQDS